LSELRSSELEGLGDGLIGADKASESKGREHRDAEGAVELVRAHLLVSERATPNDAAAERTAAATTQRPNTLIPQAVAEHRQPAGPRPVYQQRQDRHLVASLQHLACAAQHPLRPVLARAGAAGGHAARERRGEAKGVLHKPN
jgi:hypothetical protein